MKEQIIKSIGEWNKERDNMDYDPALEFGMLQEEVMEYAHSYIRTVNNFVGFDIHECTKEQYEEVKKGMTLHLETEEFSREWKVNQLDALCDIIFVAVGSLYKLLKGNDKLVQEALWSVIEANEQKGKKKNKEGKITKPKDFEGPEGMLRDIICEVMDYE